MFKLQPSPYLALPASLLFAIAWGFTTPNNPFLYRIIACKYYFLNSETDPFEHLKDPGSDPVPEICKLDKVEALSSWIVTTVHVVDNVLSKWNICMKLKRGRIEGLINFD